MQFNNSVVKAGGGVLAALFWISCGVANDRLDARSERQLNAEETASAFELGGMDFYVSPTGSDSNPGTLAAPFRTIRKCTYQPYGSSSTSGLHAGDTCYVRAGTYAETLNSYAGWIPSGTSWTAPVTISAYPGERPVLRPGSGGHVVNMTGKSQYIVINGFEIDGTGLNTGSVCYYVNEYNNTEANPGSAHHIRGTNLDIHSCPGNCVLFENVNAESGGKHAADYNEILNSELHDCGFNPSKITLPGHGLYIQSSHNLFDRLVIHGINGWGGHFYKYLGTNGVDANYNTIRNSLIYDVAKSLEHPGAGLGIYVGDGNLAYNNIIRDSPTAVGVSVTYGATNSKVYNNTIYNNAAAASVGYGCVEAAG